MLMVGVPFAFELALEKSTNVVDIVTCEVSVYVAEIWLRNLDTLLAIVTNE